MRTICLTVVFLALAVLLAGQAPKPEPAPAITDAHRAQFFKAQLQINQAQAAMTAAQQTMQAAVTDLSKDCGEKFTPQMGPQATQCASPSPSQRSLRRRSNVSTPPSPKNAVGR